MKHLPLKIMDNTVYNVGVSGRGAPFPILRYVNNCDTGHDIGVRLRQQVLYCRSLRSAA